MAVACSPPLLLQGLDYADMTACPQAEERYAAAFKKLLDALEDARAGKVRYRAWYANLKPIDASALIREKVDGLHGRDSLTDHELFFCDQVSNRLRSIPRAGLLNDRFEPDAESGGSK
jgi:hypothetical protein